MDSQFLGTALEMLILEVAAQGPTYGYAVAQTVAERGDGYFELKEGTLYPALHPLERQQMLRSSWTEAEGRRRKYYELTDAGRAEAGRAETFLAQLRRWHQRSAGAGGAKPATG